MNPRILCLFCVFAVGVRAATPPAITGAAPDPIDAGGQAFLLAIAGTGFDSGAVARLSETALSTTFVSSTRLLAEITPGLRAVSGRPILTVANPDGTVSNGRPIHISPVVLGISPRAALAGGPAVTVTVTGLGLTAAGFLVWSAAGKQTVLVPNFVDSTKCTAVIPRELLTVSQSAAIQIVQPLLELTSATSVPFDVMAAPAIASLSPNPVDAGGEYFQVTVTGTGFSPQSVVKWAGTPLGTTYLSSTQLKAAIPPELRPLSGTFPLTVAIPGVATSNAAPFTVSPVLFTVSPARASAGGPPVGIAATGVGFTRGDVLTLNAAALSTTYVSSTALSAVIPPAALRTPGTATVQVIDSAGAGRSLPQAFTIVAAPAISTILPSSATAGSSGFTLTVNVANCPAGCAVQWNGSPLATAHPAESTVTAWVPANLIVAAGSAVVSLVNQYGGASNSTAFTIHPAAALISSLSPRSVTAGSAAFPLTVSGSGFTPGSQVLWNGVALGTTYAGATRLTGYVTSELVSLRAGVGVGVSVLNPGGAESNSVTLVIDPPRPSILAIAPGSALAGIAALEIAISGSNFAANCVVRWNGTPVGTTFTDAGHLTVSVPPALLGNPGAIPITVTNPSGLVSAAITFTVIPSTPAASGVSPATVTEGSAGFTLTVSGAYFTPASTVRWNGAPLATTFVSTAQVSAVVPAGLVAAAGSVGITVSNPGGLTSPAVAFVVAAAAPAVLPGGVGNAFSSLAPIAPGALISIYGTNLATSGGRAVSTPLPESLNGTSVSINGVPAPLLFVSATQINAQAPFETAPGTASLVVHSGPLSSAPVTVEVRASAPGILTLDGGSHALAVNYPGGALNSARDPVHPGEYVVVYLTGQGLLDHALANGAEAPADPLSVPLAAVRASLGGEPAEVAFAGMAPGFVGLLQVNLRTPAIPGGEQPLDVTVGGAVAGRTVLSVAPNR